MSGRPEALFGLFSSLETLDGVGPKTAANFAGLGVHAPRDLLFTLPINVLDRRHRNTIEGLDCPTITTVAVTIGAHRPPRTKGAAYRISVVDAEAAFQLVFFHARGDYLARILPQGSRRVVSGKLERFDGVYQMVHPDYILSETEVDTIPPFEPVYPLTSGITQKVMFKATRAALKLLPDLTEWIDPGQIRKAGWPDVREAFTLAHRPQAPQDISITAAARERLAYDEMFAHQMTLALARLTERQKKGRATHGTGDLQMRLIESLPYPLTGAQQRAIADVNRDMAEAVRMNRLLQGDVGAGKTLVAFLALLRAVEGGGQGVLMAPTEILARQHLQSLKPMAEHVGVRLDILTGRDTGKERTAKLEDLANGNIGVLVGTHAVFQKGVTFSDLRLAVIDEQHRFGVQQRMALGQKGAAVDVLVMTATPIPRSLALAQFGDMDVSVLDEKPPGRMPIKTALVSVDRMEEVVSRLCAVVEGGRQCYWVCPLVEESEVVDLTAAEDRFKKLRAALGEGVVGLVHGQMPAAEKDAAMAGFESGQTKVLVATTVIEVGVNVPNATIMVIERAEFFGLAQLHQLRGRVGRGTAASTCLLLYQPPLSESGQRRLEVLRETEDGFMIAETDLKMRGAGDVIGTAQSGLPRFWIADLERQAGLMQIAQSDARKLLADDPGLATPRGQAARMLLWLLRKDESIRLITVG
ncbi:DNA helicase RecG [Roseobacter denitrificans]|uniref:ATP-dependent DNA helicase RecG n=1 Tax=Roseobacter denitrificans (strain ATCC 33942 / OCh 114) TaxID=375451 RepID=Q166D9_ROSDO|nr:ATP-dependent DNA helicase RecG [Roseobacter denitrificans]ABG32154.1 ATP-dependent DNA helicase RecG, putative [Roseobacter denitrificans OCh 114]AVL51659.1 DNA helicase RecG [Roseobacter denitrificans]SFF78050.1 ATP-dependent DNA helicase RecG [Roseobacter denitrificans OCh 114]